MRCAWLRGGLVVEPRPAGDRLRDGVLAANRAFYDALESGDMDLLSAVWVPGPDTLCVHPGAEPLRGTSTILRSWAAVMSAMLYMQFFLTDVEVALGPGDGVVPQVAMVSCTQNLLTAGDDESFTGAKAVASNVFVRTAAGWRLWSHHSSPVISVVQGAGDDFDEDRP